MKKQTVSLIIALFSAHVCSAAVVLSGNFNSGSPAPTLTFQEDVTFTVTTAGDVRFIVFDEWTVSDGNANTAINAASQQLAYTLNQTISTINLSNLTDNYGSPLSAISANDGYLQVGIIPVVIGDTLVVKAGTYSFNSNSAFNPRLSSSDVIFTGNMFLADAGGLRRSSNVGLIPEPSTLMLSALAMLSFVRRRR